MLNPLCSVMDPNGTIKLDPENAALFNLGTSSSTGKICILIDQNFCGIGLEK